MSNRQAQFLYMVSVVALFLPPALHAQKQYPLCYVAPGFVVGEAPDLPFTAHLTHTTLQLAPDGTLIRGEKIGAASEYVVRDGLGRVMVRRPSQSSSSKSVTEGWWSELICDPTVALDGTEIFMEFRDSTGRIKPIPSGAVMETPADAEGEALVKPRLPHAYTTATFQSFHNRVPSRVMSQEHFHGLPAVRYRFTATKEPGSIYEIVHSDSLLTQVALVTWATYPRTLTETEFTEFDLSEPQATLLDIPHGLKVRHSPIDTVR